VGFSSQKETATVNDLVMRRRGRPKGSTGRAAVLTPRDIRHAMETAIKRKRMSDRAELLLALSIGLGLDARELSSLTWGDVWDKRGSVRAAIRIRGGLNQAERHVPIGSLRLRQLLAGHAERVAIGQRFVADAPVFASQKSGRALSPVSIGRLVGQLYREAGIAGASLRSARRTLEARREEQLVDLLG
jgi:integrase